MKNYLKIIYSKKINLKLKLAKKFQRSPTNSKISRLI